MSLLPSPLSILPQLAVKEHPEERPPALPFCLPATLEFHVFISSRGSGHDENLENPNLCLLL